MAVNHTTSVACATRKPNSLRSSAEVSVGRDDAFGRSRSVRERDRPVGDERSYQATRQRIQPAQLPPPVFGDGSLAEVTGNGALHGLTFQSTMTSHRPEMRRLDRVLSPAGPCEGPRIPLRDQASAASGAGESEPRAMMMASFSSAPMRIASAVSQNQRSRTTAAPSVPYVSL